MIIGSSSGFGAAASLELARAGLNIFGVHFDRRSNMPQVEQVIGSIQSTGRDVLFFNINAADPAKRTEALNQMQEHWNQKGGCNFIKVFLHSVAFGSLKAYLADSPEEELTQMQMDMTVDVMGNNLVYWVQDLFRRKMLGHGSRIYAMTSAGGHSVIPNYGAVSAAKAVLESHIRQLAYRTDAARDYRQRHSGGRDPHPRLQQDSWDRQAGGVCPNAKSRRTSDHSGRRGPAIVALMGDQTHWMTGNVIRVDGGEDIVT